VVELPLIVRVSFLSPSGRAVLASLASYAIPPKLIAAPQIKKASVRWLF
jgi:hypothetical protein